MIRAPWTKFFERMADRFADKLMVRLEKENALPLPEAFYDVVVDDPEMQGRHEFRAIAAISPIAAAVESYRRAMRREGFRCMAGGPPGDEVTVSHMGLEVEGMFATVHRMGSHPDIDYQAERKAVGG